MLSVNVGPFALPVAHVLLLLALWLAASVGQAVAGEAKATIGRIVGWMAVTGFVVARLVFVFTEFDLYRVTPWALLDLKDGGYTPWAGALAGLAVPIWRGWRQPPLRRALAGGLLAGAGAWLLGSTALGIRDTPGLPPLTLTTLDGTAVELQTLARGQPTVVNLWATWCMPCRVEMPVLAAAQSRESGVRFVFVNQGESAATGQQYLSAAGLPLQHVLLYPATRLGPAAGSSGLPTTLFYDAQGKLVDRHLGALSSVSLASKLRLFRRPVGSPTLGPTGRINDPV
jgi:thiol-disulfide isomerase/thioredoxin